MRSCFKAVYITLALGVSCLANAQVAGFEIDVVKDAYTNEAIDLTVRALDKDGKVYEDYRGAIYVDIKGDDDVIAPEEIAGYEYGEIDKGIHTFSKAITFKNTGEMTITVVDVDDPSIEKIATVKVSSRSGQTVTDGKIEVLSPTEGSTVTSEELLVKGKTAPNSALDIYLNDKKVAQTQSESNGDFEKQIDGLTTGINKIKVEVLDGSGKVSATSATIEVRFSTDLPKFEKIDILPSRELFTWEKFNIEVHAEAGLTEVIASIGATDITCEEDNENPGIYRGVSTASESEGDFNVDISLTNTLGAELKNTAVTSFRVIKVNFENIKVETLEDQVKFTFQMRPDSEKITYFKIVVGPTGSEEKQEIVTYEKTKILTDTTYTWYIPRLEKGEYEAQIFALDKDKRELGPQSDVLPFIIDLDSAKACYIDNVSGVVVRVVDHESIISWHALADAKSYKVFKKDADGTYTLFDEVTDNQYIIPIVGEEIIFEEFAIKATCQEEDIAGESYEFSDGVNVQTGPEEMLILMALLTLATTTYLLARKSQA